MGIDLMGNPNIARISTTQQISLSPTSARSAAVGSRTAAVSLWSDVDCWVRFGDGTVTAAATPGANIKIQSGDRTTLPISGGFYIAALSDSGGELNIWEHPA